MPGDRHIRVFVSSTFRDMQAERDYLVKFIFPQLRRLCESRGVTWGEVDLRWGVTDEQAAEGRVLPICLEEIKRCQPYFIGLLGERYGWVPEAFSKELLEREEWLTQHLDGKKSVTELEILKGVLNNPEMKKDAFFYFRDPVFLKSVPEDKRKDFVAESIGDAEKLKELKDKIRVSLFPVRENYSDPKALGELVLADMTAVINQLYPEGSQPDPLGREAMDHAAYVQSRTKVYIGRQEYFDRLDSHAAGSSDEPLVVLGESGLGKSALLAKWAEQWRVKHPDALVLEHFIGATPYSADWAAMLRRLMGEFKRKLGLSGDIPDKPEALRSAFPNWLYMAAAKGRIVLVLDALNQLEDRDGATDLTWLPPKMSENLRLVVSTLPGRPLDEIKKRSWPTLEVKPLTLEERKKVIEDYLQYFSKKLEPARAVRIAEAPPAANPLYLRAVLDELRVFGVYEKLDERIGYYLEAQTPYELYEKIIARWEEDYEGDTDLVGDTLSLLWAVRRGLSETELLDALGKKNAQGEHEPLPRAQWSLLYLAMADGLISRGGLLTFAHDFLREAVKQAYVQMEKHRHAAHLRLADYFEYHSVNQRCIDEVPWQLCEATAWERLHTLFACADFFKVAWQQNEFEVKTCWTAIETHTCLRLVEAFSKIISQPEAESDKDLVWLLGILLSDTGHLYEALRLRSNLAEYYKSTDDLNKRQANLGNLVAILQALGDLEGTMALCKEQEQICRQLDSQDGLAACFGNQGIILKIRGDTEGAMVQYKKQERICRQLGKLDSLQICLCNQGNILRARGEFDKSLALFKEQERISRQLENKNILQACLLGQGNIMKDLGKFKEAMALYKEQEQICRQVGKLDDLQIGLGNQGQILLAHKDLDGAMVLAKEQERISRQLDNPLGLQVSLCTQGNTLRLRGDMLGALALFKEVERISRQLNMAEGLPISLINQATILPRMGYPQQGLAKAEEAYRLAVSHHYVHIVRQIEPILTTLRQAVKDE